MAQLTQPDAIRRLLEADRPWAVYALGDLTPGFAEHSEWHALPAGTPGGPALILLYRAFSTPVLFALGPAEGVRPLLAEVAGEACLYLSIQPGILPLVKERYRVEHETAMWRMILPPDAFRPLTGDGAEQLSLADLEDVRALYEDGRPAGEVPDFFSPAMLDQGVFFGIREGSDLIAVAGTHLVSEQESVGAVGNVYTRRDRRGRGLAARVTSAVAAELRLRGLRTVALNVNQANLNAIRVYERLGFIRYCPFYEGLAMLQEQPR
jgi:ribosomal protein S18 acetylase RimI-like enzyme